MLRYFMLLPVALAPSAWCDTTYAGSRACAGCHQAIYSTYLRSAMGQSLTRAEQPAQLALAPVPVAVGRFKVFRRGDRLYQSETEIGQFGNVIGENTFPLEYVLGSGVNGYSYIVVRGNRLMEAPLSYYSKSKKWDFSPGYETAGHGFERPVGAACAACHSGRAQPVPNRLGMYQYPPFLEMAIGCENCHGPGGQHAAGGSKAAIVNPAKLPPGERERRCGECHQDPQARPDTDLLAHMSSMRLSKCYRSSSGRLTCTTCHDPHTTVSAADSPAYYRSKCLTCHTDESCSLPAHGPACAECHMPKRALRVIPHTALTNHRIPAR